MPAAILVMEPSWPAPICLEIIVKTAAPRHIRTFVLKPAAFLWTSLSSPTAAPNTTAKIMLSTSPGQTIVLPFNQRFIYLYAEMSAGLFNMSKHLVARL